MKKTILALSLLGLTGTVAHARGKVEIYGLIDTGYVKESGTDTRMDGNQTSFIGFRGTEDLGDNLKATFELEKRFNVNDGTTEDDGSYFDNRVHAALGSRRTPDWQGAANVGLKGDWGAVQFGRVNDLAVEYYEDFDPFGMDSTGATLSKYSRLRSELHSNTVRYDSSEWNGFGISATFTLKGDKDINDSVAQTDGILNHGFAGSVHYDNGPLVMAATYSREADSNKSYTINAGVAYEFGPATVSLGYHHSNLRDVKGVVALGDDLERMKQQEVLFGLDYELGPGMLKAAYTYGRLSGRDDGEGGHAHKYALGYTYSLSKRTELYGVVSYTESSNRDVGEIYNANGASDTSMTGVQIGMTHKF